MCIVILWIHQHTHRRDESSRVESIRADPRSRRRRRSASSTTPTPPPLTLLRAVKRAARNLVDLHLYHIYHSAPLILHSSSCVSSVVDLLVVSGTASVVSLARQQTEIPLLPDRKFDSPPFTFGLPQVNFLFMFNAEVFVFLTSRFRRSIDLQNPSRMSEESQFCAFSMGEPVRR